MTGIPQAAIDAARTALTAQPGALILSDAGLVAALEAAAPHIVAAERERIVTLARKGFDALDNETRAVLAAMMARWAAAITDDPVVLGEIAGLFDREQEG